MDGTGDRRRIRDVDCVSILLLLSALLEPPADEIANYECISYLRRSLPERLSPCCSFSSSLRLSIPLRRSTLLLYGIDFSVLFSFVVIRISLYISPTCIFYYELLGNINKTKLNNSKSVNWFILLNYIEIINLTSINFFTWYCKVFQ